MKTLENWLRFDKIIVSRGWSVFPRHSVRDCLKSFLSGYTIGLIKINNLSYMQRFYFRYIGLQHQ